MNSRNQSFIIYAILLIAIIAIVAPNLKPPAGTVEPLTINQLALDVQNGKVVRFLLFLVMTATKFPVLHFVQRGHLIFLR